jgi:hypothetical protein
MRGALGKVGERLYVAVTDSIPLPGRTQTVTETATAADTMATVTGRALSHVSGRASARAARSGEAIARRM